jgi:DNA-binding GntR family transcriptional regulator
MTVSAVQKAGSASTEVGVTRAGNLVSLALLDIRKRLFSGMLKAGDRIREAELARDFGISRAPVREALRMLEQSGLVVKLPNQSYSVVTFSEQDIFELATMRIALESLAARLSFGRAGTIAAMKSAIANMKLAVAQNDYNGVTECDRAFHMAMVDFADHRRLRETYSALSDQMRLAFIGFSRRRPDMSQIIEGHELLLSCALNGSPQDLAELLTQHIQASSGILRNTL